MPVPQPAGRSVTPAGGLVKRNARPASRTRSAECGSTNFDVYEASFGCGGARSREQEVMRATKAAFIRQQGFPVTHSHDDLYRALMFQPRAVGVLIVLGTVSQSAALFLGLSIVLLWGTI